MTPHRIEFRYTVGSTTIAEADELNALRDVCNEMVESTRAAVAASSSEFALLVRQSGGVEGKVDTHVAPMSGDVTAVVTIVLSGVSSAALAAEYSATEALGNLVWGAAVGGVLNSSDFDLLTADAVFRDVV